MNIFWSVIIIFCLSSLTSCNDKHTLHESIMEYFNNASSDAEWVDFCQKTSASLKSEKRLEYSQVESSNSSLISHKIDFFGFRVPIVEAKYSSYSIKYYETLSSLSILLYSDEVRTILNRGDSVLFFETDDKSSKKIKEQSKYVKTIFPDVVTLNQLILYLLGRDYSNITCDLESKTKSVKQLQRLLMSVELYQSSENIYKNKSDRFSYIKSSNTSAENVVMGIQENNGMENRILIQFDKKRNHEIIKKIVQEFYSKNDVNEMPEWIYKLNEITSSRNISREAIEKIKNIMENSGIKNRDNNDL